MAQKDAPGCGERARVLGEAGGGVESPESALDFVGTEDARGEIGTAWGRDWGRSQRGNEEGTLAIYPAWSRRGKDAALRRIKPEISTAERGKELVAAGEEEEQEEWGSSCQRERGRRSGSRLSSTAWVLSAVKKNGSGRVGPLGSERKGVGVGSSCHSLCG